jgi:hypothetical protein
MTPRSTLIGGSLFGMCVALSGCGGSTTAAETPKQAMSQKPGIVADDKSRCDFKGRADREVIESNGPGATIPNVRRVFGILGEGEDRRRVLFCREIDTNLDGSKDVVRTYNDKGDAVEEQADSDYNGKVDTWIRFGSGRIAKVEIDHNGDGRPDELKYYVKGKLSRVQRDNNFDGKPDIWEVYADGTLERMGVDLDFDGHVDRWDRDEVAHRASEEKEKAEEEKAAAEKKAEEPPPAKNPRDENKKGAGATTPADKGAKPADKGAAKPDDKAAMPAAGDATKK